MPGLCPIFASLPDPVVVYPVTMTEVLLEYQGVLIWVSGISLFFFVASLAAVPWMIARIPARYFRTLAEERTPAGTGKGLTLSDAAVRVVLNLAGLILAVAGVIMLFVPGQGLLTILAGLVLIDFPGKRRLILYLVRQPNIQKGLNWIRKRKGVPPFVFPPK